MNRKYLQSTGILLRNLHDDPNQMPQQQLQQHQQSPVIPTSLPPIQSQIPISQYNYQQMQYNHPYQQNYGDVNMPYMNIPSSDGIYRYPSGKRSYISSSQPHVYQQPLPPTTSTNYYTRQNQSTAPSLKKPATVPELPETFGVPIKRTSSTIPKYTTSASSSASVANTSTDSNKIIKINESTSAPTLAATTLKESSKLIDSEIEIICEKQSTSTSKPSKALTIKSGLSLINQTNTDETLKTYLNERLNNSELVLASKPQSNFQSNFECLNQLTKQMNYEDRKRPYCRLNNKLKRHLARAYNAEESDDESGEVLHAATSGDDNCKIKRQKLIVIDDTSADDTHKPWITPALINLIKQRNLLQSKLNESGQQPDPEMVKKFKNLRNKVTKLVKNARKEYLAKIVQENASSNDVVFEKAVALATKPTSELQPTQNTINTTPSQSSSQTTLVTSSSASSSSTSLVTSAQSGLMMNLYNSFFNQYLHQYTQKRAETSDQTNSLKEQAAFYAQQQVSIQTQLEQCLNAITQQYLNDLKANATQSTNTVNLVASKSQQQQQQQMPSFGITYQYNKTA